MSLAFVLNYQAPAVSAHLRAFSGNPALIWKAVYWDAPFYPALTPSELLDECTKRLLDEASIWTDARYRPRDQNAIGRLLAAHVALCELTR